MSVLSVNVGESQIAQYLNVTNLGVIYHQFLNFDDHVAAICKITSFYIRNIGES